MKRLFLIALFLVISTPLLLAQSQKGRNGKINRKSGGFVKTTFVCTLHDKNCLFTNGYHEITADSNGQPFCTYNGKFLGRRFHGEGEYHNVDGSLDYKGSFTYGFFKTGTLTNKWGDTLSGTFKKEDKKWYLNNGYVSTSRWYTLSDSPTDLQRGDNGDKMFVRGYVKDGQLHGHVYFKVLTGNYKGTEFDGYFVEGKIQGCGTMKIFRNDDFLTPDYSNSNDCYISFKSLNPSGDIYMGQWQNCAYGGWGLLISQQFATSYGYWDHNTVSTDIPYNLVASKLGQECDFNIDWEDYNPKIDSSDYSIIPSLPDLGDGGDYDIGVVPFDTVDNRGNVSRGVKITHKINYIKGTVQGDYPPGSYNLNSSKNAKALLLSLDSTVQVVSQIVLDSLYYNLIDSTTEVVYKITATTDRSKIRTAIDYNWKDFNLDSIAEGVVYSRDPYDPTDDFSIGKKIVINQKFKYNSQLAFLRALGIQNYLKDSLNINTDLISFKIQIDTTAQHRAIGIEMLIKNKKDNSNPRIVHNKRVEMDIPSNTSTNSNSAAIIIYYSDYLHNDQISTNGLIYAQSDAMLVKNYFIKTLGINNIKVYHNEYATTSDINLLFSGTLLEMARNGIENFYIYYQGHGFANKNKSLFMLPYNTRVDNNGNPILQDVDSLNGYITSATKIIKDSTNTDVNFFTIFDACASYTATKGSVYGARYVPQNNTNSCIISASEMFKTAKYDATIEHSLLSYGFCYSLFDYQNTDLNSDKNLTFEEVFLATKKFVIEQSSQSSLDSSEIQTPSNYGNGNWSNNTLNINNIR